MKVRDPHELLAAIDLERWNHLRGISLGQVSPSVSKGPTYVEPSGAPTIQREWNVQTPDLCHSETHPGHDKSSDRDVMTGKVQLLGDFIDTDAVCTPDYIHIQGVKTHIAM